MIRARFGRFVGYGQAAESLVSVLRKIASEHPVLGEHLAATVRTGTFVSYTPDPRSPMRWDI